MAENVVDPWTLPWTDFALVHSIHVIYNALLPL